MYLRCHDGHRVVGGTKAWWGPRVGGGEPGRDRLSAKYLGGRAWVPLRRRALCEVPGRRPRSTARVRQPCSAACRFNDWLMAVAVQRSPAIVLL